MANSQGHGGTPAGCEETDASELLRLTAAEFTSVIDWPPTETADDEPGR